jgi:hypothetical protein
MIPVHAKELQVIRDLVERAKAPTITYSESVAKMRDQAERKRIQHLEEIDDHLEELARRTPTTS